MRKNIKYKDYVVENKEKKLLIGNYIFLIKIKMSIFYEIKKVEVKRNKEELKKELFEKVLKELEYIILVLVRIIDVKYNFKVNKNMLEYLIIV